MYTLTEITNALKVIQNVCTKHYHCEECPLRKGNNNCAVTDTIPKNWELYNPKNIRLIL